MPPATAQIVTIQFEAAPPTASVFVDPVPAFAPPLNPSFDYQEPRELLTDRVTVHKGYDQVRPLQVRPIQTVNLEWKALNEDQKDYIVSFFDGLNGTNGPFWFTPLDKVPSPGGALPTLTEVDSGITATIARTIHVMFTWHNSVTGEETKPSGRRSMQVGENKFIRATVPVLPNRADGFRVYASRTLGSEKLQATVTSGRTWTQDGSIYPLSTVSATPPTTNNLNGTVKYLLEGPYTPVRIRPNRWRMQLTFREQQF